MGGRRRSDRDGLVRSGTATSACALPGARGHAQPLRSGSSPQGDVIRHRRSVSRGDEPHPRDPLFGGRDFVDALIGPWPLQVWADPFMSQVMSDVINRVFSAGLDLAGALSRATDKAVAQRVQAGMDKLDRAISSIQSAALDRLLS